MTDRLKEARKQADIARLAEWACGVLEIGKWRYDREGWRDVARIGANKIIDMLGYIAAVEAENKRLRGDLKVVVRELNKVLNDRSIGDEISVRKSAVRPALHALEERRRQRR